MKFINSFYNEEFKKSYVEVKHLGKIFEGTACCHPEDTPSHFFGCYIAELRAEIKALKYERKIAKEEAEICRKFCQSCLQYAKFDSKDASAKSMARQLSVKINKVNDLTAEINDRIMLIQREILERKRFLDKVNKIKETVKNS